jgi:hypothetical protein
MERLSGSARGAPAGVEGIGTGIGTMKVTADRIDPFTLKVNTASGLDIRLFASEDVPIDRASLAGSMGDSSYLLKGSGSVASPCSAPHGAGRLAARREGRKSKAGELDPIRIVTKIDPVKTRADIAAELWKTMMEEAPSQYKPVTPVIDTVAGAGIAQAVARMRPLLTIKG